MLITVNVTQEHIDLGSVDMCDVRLCPVARALTPLLNVPVTVGVETCGFRDTFGRAGLPREVSRFIQRLINHDAVGPITFEMDIPDEFVVKP